MFFNWNIYIHNNFCRYRNKCEFTVGIDEETNLPTVGFRIGSYVNGTIGVGPVDSLIHIPDSMKLAAKVNIYYKLTEIYLVIDSSLNNFILVLKVFQDFVRSSDLQVFNPEFHTGHFRQLMARSAPDQLMLVIGIHPQDLNEEKLNEFKKDVVDFFINRNGKIANVTSLYYQKIVKK